ncbi:MAG: methyltransferase domain-containing protein [Cyclobacteriaceae bacterium]|nr:methyltransferase domain-containing protein [Cyclobacteriaceae bacterium]
MKKNNLAQHWNNVYTKSSQEKLGWFETDLFPTLQLIDKTHLPKSARIAIIGAGSTTLVDELVAQNYTHIIATDISNVALNNLKERLNTQAVKFIIDDLTNPTILTAIAPVNLWIDRAVLHFFTDTEDRNAYFNLLKSKLAKGGYALFAQFSLAGANKCSGLPVHRYSKKILADKLGNGFELIESFNYTYTMPSGDTRPYVYALFKKLS